MLTQEVAKFQLADVFSKVGGILNLWAGITVVLILEVLELFMRLVLRSFKKSEADAEAGEEERKRNEKEMTRSRVDVTLRSMRQKHPPNSDSNTLRAPITAW